ncbi:MAG: ABC transporter permease [Candidatus Saganbacteria bacterium]|nr:ABC transporter permease [Candidatus Saganbacteria bacterium]
MLDSRLVHIIRKEFIQLFRDKRLIGAVILAPIIQLLVFGYVATLDLRNINTAVFDRDQSYLSRQFISSFSNSTYFRIVSNAKSPDEEKRTIDSGRAQVAINIPPDFSKNIISGRQSRVQFILDGTNSNSAGIALAYINGIVFENVTKILNDRLKAMKRMTDRLNVIDARVRVFHNQEMKSVNYMVPGIIAVLLTILTSLLTAVSIVKEKEYGTMEQLIVSPIRPWELMAGKMAPFIILGFIDVILVIFISVLWFRVPILGNIYLLLALCAIYIIASLGIGLMISTISNTMQQTVLTLIFIILPSILLSGFIFPIANMPFIIQIFTYIIPLRYFLNIVRGIFLKGIGLQYLWKDILMLFVLGSAIFIFAVRRFRKKIG